MDTPAVFAPPTPPRVSRHLESFAAQILSRLERGEHVLVHGPRGTGKSTLLAALQVRLRSRGMPCGLAARTAGLADIVDAIAMAYPRVAVDDVSRRAMAMRLRLAAEQRRGVLLLDHAVQLSTAMVGLLRRLRGGVIAVLLCVDADAPFEQACARSWRRHALGERMPLMADAQLRRRLCALCKLYGPLPERADLRHLVRSASGRVGWLEQCARRLSDARYWQQQRLAVTGLCIDIEMSLRSTQGPRWREQRQELAR